MCVYDVLIRSGQSKTEDELPAAERISVRVNAVNTPFFSEDVLQAVRMFPSSQTSLPY